MISNTACGAQEARMSVGTTGVLTAMPIVRSCSSFVPRSSQSLTVPSYRRTQAAWRAVESAAYAPKHVPAALLKRDADFAPSGTRGGGPPV
jgi:hypothetical protein